MISIIPAGCRSWICVLVFVFLGHAGSAQQQLAYSQYMFNSLSINPAYAGTDRYLNATFQGRQQWHGYQGSPESQMLSIHSPLKKKKVSLGGIISRESMGVSQLYKIYLQYAYRLKVSKKSTLSMGLQAGFTNYREDLTDLTLPSGTIDPTFAGNVNTVMPNFGVGFYYYSSRHYLGLSFPQVAQNLLFRNDTGISRELRHYFLAGGYLFDLSPHVKLKPNFLLKAVKGAPVDVDINPSVLFHDVVWFGVSYRYQNAITALVEFQISPSFRVGLSYDWAISDVRTSGFLSGAQEVMINYRAVKLLPHTVVSPRYF